MAQAVSGLFTSAEQARWAIDDLTGAGFAEAQITTGHPELGAETGVALGDAADGHTVVSVAAGTRETEAIEIMSRHSAEMLRRPNGGEIGDVSDAPREADGQPVVTEPAPAGVAYARDIDPHEGNEGAQVERGNLAQTSGQVYDMMRTSSDDGTVPPTAHREAITAPPVGAAERFVPNAHSNDTATAASNGGSGSAGAIPVSGGPLTPLEKFAARDTSETEVRPDPEGVRRAARMVEPARDGDPVTGETERPIPQERHGR